MIQLFNWFSLLSVNFTPCFINQSLRLPMPLLVQVFKTFQTFGFWYDILTIFGLDAVDGTWHWWDWFTCGHCTLTFNSHRRVAQSITEAVVILKLILVQDFVELDLENRIWHDYRLISIPLNNYSFKATYTTLIIFSYCLIRLFIIV